MCANKTSMKMFHFLAYEDHCLRTLEMNFSMDSKEQKKKGLKYSLMLGLGLFKALSLSTVIHD
jgi:hypothetical protein